MIPVALVCSIASVYYDSQPIEWGDYSRSSLNKHIRDKRMVLVFFNAEWDATSQMVEQQAIDTFWVRRLIRRRNIVALRADLTAYRSGHLVNKMTPTIEMYSPDSADYLEIEGLVSEDQLYQDLLDFITRSR